MSFRKEKKFRLSLSDLMSLKANLYNKGLSRLHRARKINSYYLDTIDLDMFRESEEGLLPRKKIRIRWYDDNIRDLNLETKISSIEGRFKSQKKMLKIGNLEKFSLIDNIYGKVTPSLNVSYKREYFTHQKLRLTFDTNIQYINLRALKKKVFIDTETVMEIKADYSLTDDYIEKIVPYPSSRFSKYSRGILFSKKDY